MVDSLDDNINFIEFLPIDNVFWPMLTLYQCQFWIPLLCIVFKIIKVEILNDFFIEKKKQDKMYI